MSARPLDDTARRAHTRNDVYLKFGLSPVMLLRAEDGNLRLWKLTLTRGDSFAKAAAKATRDGNCALHQARPCICRCVRFSFFLATRVFFLATRVFFLAAGLPAAGRGRVFLVVRGEVKTPVKGHLSHLDPIYV